MKFRMPAIAIALVVGLIAGAAARFVAGRRGQRQAREVTTPLSGPMLPTIVTGGKAVQQGERTAAARDKAFARNDLAGLPPGEAWRQLLEMDQSASADAVRALLDSMSRAASTSRRPRSSSPLRTSESTWPAGTIAKSEAP